MKAPAEDPLDSVLPISLPRRDRIGLFDAGVEPGAVSCWAIEAAVGDIDMHGYLGCVAHECKVIEKHDRLPLLNTV